jgi:hypothetical protein
MLDHITQLALLLNKRVGNILPRYFNLLVTRRTLARSTAQVPIQKIEPTN